MLKRSLLYFLMLILLITGCADPMALIESAATEINFELTSSACRDEQWVVPGGREISLTLTNSMDVPQIFIIMARQSTPPFDYQDQDRIYFSIGVPPGITEASFIAPAMPAEYQVICGPADDLEPIGRNLLVVVQPDGN